MLNIYKQPPNWNKYNVSLPGTKYMKQFFDNETLGGPSFLEYGPEKIVT